MCTTISLVLNDLISPTQGSFVQGRNISRNIFLCQELVKHYGRSNASVSCVMNVDIQKASDSVSLESIHDLFVALNFPSHFTLSMECVSLAPNLPCLSMALQLDIFSLKGVCGQEIAYHRCQLFFVWNIHSHHEYADNIVGIQFHPMCKELKVNNPSFAMINLF